MKAKDPRDPPQSPRRADGAGPREDEGSRDKGAAASFNEAGQEEPDQEDAQSAQLLDVDPADEVHPDDLMSVLEDMLDDEREPADPRAEPPAPMKQSGAATRRVARQPADEGTSLAIDKPIESAGAHMSTLQSFEDLARLGRVKGAAARLEAYLGALPAPQRELIYKMMVEFGWKPHDPDVVFLMLFGHVVAAGNTIPSAIDAAFSGVVESIHSALAGYADVADIIQSALADARGLSQEFFEAARRENETIAKDLAAALRESAIEAAEAAVKLVDAARKQAIEEMQKEAASARAEAAKMMKTTSEAAALAPLKISSEIIAIVKDQLAKNQTPATSRWAEAWKWAACAMSGALAGMAIAMLMTRQ